MTRRDWQTRGRDKSTGLPHNRFGTAGLGRGAGRGRGVVPPATPRSLKLAHPNFFNKELGRREQQGEAEGRERRGEDRRERGSLARKWGERK